MFSKPVTHLVVDFPSWLASLQPLASLCWFSPAFSIVIDNCSLSAMLQGSKLQPWAAECCPLCLSLTGAFQSSNWSFCFHQTRATWEVHPFRQSGVGPLPWITAVPQWGAAGLQQLKFFGNAYCTFCLGRYMNSEANGQAGTYMSSAYSSDF